MVLIEMTLLDGSYHIQRTLFDGPVQKKTREAFKFQLVPLRPKQLARVAGWLVGNHQPDGTISCDE